MHLLPVTTKEDVQQHNRDFFCVPDDLIRDYNTTSGTLGDPVLVPLTQNDQQRLAYNEWLSFSYMEVKAGDTVQLMLTLDRQFMAGMAYYQGLQQIGATAVRTGPGLPPLQWDMIERLNVRTLVAVPSFLLKLIQYAKDHHIDMSRLKVKNVLAIGESIRDDQLQPNTLLRTIQDAWPLQVFGTYAATEMQTGFTECIHGRGGHLHPELIIAELLDEAGHAVSEGDVGEITITTLGVEAMPLLRYRTGDMAKIYTDACPCGRQTPRIGPILGRKRQMIKYKGTTLFPPALSDLVQQVPGIGEYFVELNSNSTGQDDLRLYLVTDLTPQECNEGLHAVLKHKLRVLPEIIYIDKESMQTLQFPPGSRKQVRFRDLRKEFNA